jgi:hypothetical protein
MGWGKTVKKSLLADYFRLHRRYHRSINLERDFDKLDAIEGYILTERSSEALQRILTAIGNPQAHHAWTITGVYGSGKSAFSLFLTALCAPEESAFSKSALAIAKRTLPENSPIFQAIGDFLPQEGMLRAIVAGAREPLRWTIIRALTNAIETQIPARKRKGDTIESILDWGSDVALGRCEVTNQQVLIAIRQLLQTVRMDLLLVVDELGKSLEYASTHRSTEDLYLLQQIEELRHEQYQVYFLGLLHQSFVGYSEQLTAIEQNEWTKIQGRFENLQLMDSPGQMTRLIGLAIEQSDAIALVCNQLAHLWHPALQAVLEDQELSLPVVASTHPLHPLTGLILPLLCTRYAQNDRSLFTFLTSDEPHALNQFLQTHFLEVDQFSTLKLYQLYDYFVESVAGLTSQANLQRWVEIQGLIQDKRSKEADVLKVLKTIGILNLVASTGTLRASPDLVALAMCDRPDDLAALKYWREQIEALKQSGTIVYRSQADELRVWEGSDFDVEAAIVSTIEASQRVSLAELLAATHPLKPMVAQRHYTNTGNLRYFEQRYVDSLTLSSEFQSSLPGADGLILYWLDRDVPQKIPTKTLTDIPIIFVTTNQLDMLRIRSQHLQALKTIQKNAPELTSDRAARGEVRHRLVSAERLLNETMQQAFNWTEEQNQCWFEGESYEIRSAREFQSDLSDLCDRTYPLALHLDNELINRRELTSQGAKARRELIEAMLKSAHLEKCGLDGYGPEVAMYYSVLQATGVHRQESGEWGFYPPDAKSGVTKVWKAIESFCVEAVAQQRSLDWLYTKLELPPYGVKAGAIPLLLAAFLIHRTEDVGVYRDGTFIPVLGAEHFELLVKVPGRFSVKHFEIAGLRSQVFQKLETVLKSPNSGAAQPGVRNASLLAIAKPLFKFVSQLPQYTLKTQRTSEETQQVLQALQTAQEPDELVFSSLPKACGFEPITTESLPDEETADRFIEALVEHIHEIRATYETLLRDCQARLYEAFGVRSRQENLREDLRVRASYLLENCIEPKLKRFVRDAVDVKASQTEWLEALVMTVADKPPRTWKDEDFTKFEHELIDLARRFAHLESLQKDSVRIGSGFETLRLAVSEADGQEVYAVIWGDEGETKQVEELLTEFLNHPVIKNNSRLQKFYAAKLSQRVLKQDEEKSQNELARTRKRSRRTVV